MLIFYNNIRIFYLILLFIKLLIFFICIRFIYGKFWDFGILFISFFIWFFLLILIYVISLYGLFILLVCFICLSGIYCAGRLVICTIFYIIFDNLLLIIHYELYSFFPVASSIVIIFNFFYFYLLFFTILWKDNCFVFRLILGFIFILESLFLVIFNFVTISFTSI